MQNYIYGDLHRIMPFRRAFTFLVELADLKEHALVASPFRRVSRGYTPCMAQYGTEPTLQKYIPICCLVHHNAGGTHLRTSIQAQDAR